MFCCFSHPGVDYHTETSPPSHAHSASLPRHALVDKQPLPPHSREPTSLVHSLTRLVNHYWACTSTVMTTPWELHPGAYNIGMRMPSRSIQHHNENAQQEHGWQDCTMTSCMSSCLKSTVIQWAQNEMNSNNDSWHTVAETTQSYSILSTNFKTQPRVEIAKVESLQEENSRRSAPTHHSLLSFSAGD